ncbi:hypothetical protein [Duncaniella freteri]
MRIHHVIPENRPPGPHAAALAAYSPFRLHQAPI